MKHNISDDVKRMQKLAGIINEATLPPTTSTQSTDVINKPDEKRLQSALKMNKILLSLLKNIDSTELDGFFKTLLNLTSLEKTSKASIMAALGRALKDMNATSSDITTETTE